MATKFSYVDKVSEFSDISTASGNSSAQSNNIKQIMTEVQKLNERKDEIDIMKNVLLDAMPLDYSFKKISSLTEEHHLKPRESRVGKIPTRGPKNKYMTKGLWLDNNYLISIHGIEHFVHHSLEYPELLSWIDFSFNSIKEIDGEVLKFKNLIIIYFHGNSIETIDTIIKLRDLPKLKRLTLHGNPVSEIPAYRTAIIHIIPQLFNLDFSPIVKREKDSSVPMAITKKLDVYIVH